MMVRISVMGGSMRIMGDNSSVSSKEWAGPCVIRVVGKTGMGK